MIGDVIFPAKKKQSAAMRRNTAICHMQAPAQFLQLLNPQLPAAEEVTDDLSVSGIATTLPKNKKKLLAIQNLQKAQDNLSQAIKKWKDTDLDQYYIIHPILGRLTVREMLFFTIYHTEHHLGKYASKIKKQQVYCVLK